MLTSYFVNIITLNTRVFKILGDILVAEERIGQGHLRWGGTIIGLVFLPNVVFILWMLVGSRRQICHKDTGLRIAAGSGIQCITIFR